MTGAIAATEKKDAQQNGTQQHKLQLVFRNYQPVDKNLAKMKERPAIPPVEKEITSRLQKIEQERPDWNTLSVAPKKPTWDLKRDITKKLEKLEMRTQRAIIEMMREKLQAGEGGDIGQQVRLRSAKDVEESESESE